MTHESPLTLKRKPGNFNRFHPNAWRIELDERMRFWAAVLADYAKDEDIQEIRCNVTVAKEKRDKSHPQLKYLNGIVYPAFYKEFERLNGARYPNEYVKRTLKMNEQVMFVEEVTNPLTGQIEFIPKSCADAEMCEVWEFTNRLLALADHIGLYIETPEEWCKRRGIDYETFKRKKQ